MKTKIIFGLFFAILISSCSSDNYSLPDTSINVPEIDGDTISISAVKSLLAQEDGYFGSLSGEEQYTFQETGLYMPAYVVSSDETGNFYQEIILQDKPESPTSGIKLVLQVNPLYTRYEIGRKIYVELDGFTVGFSNGVIALGVPQAGTNFIDKAPRAFESKLIRTTEKDSIIPVKMEIDAFLGKEKEYELENIFIELDGVQFSEEDVLEGSGKTFAGEADDFYDAEYVLQSCDDSLTTKLITSTFSDFKSLYLPKKRGRIRGVLSKTFDGKEYAIKLNSPNDIVFDDERCDFVAQEEIDDNEKETDPDPVDPEDPNEPEPDPEPEPSVDAEFLFPGADFENWDLFEPLLDSKFGDFAQKAKGEGRDGSTALHLLNQMGKNDFVFKAKPHGNLNDSYSKITFYMKGTSDKSISINLYKPDNSYYKFNLGDVEESTVITSMGSNRYGGIIDTQGEWVLITLDLSGISDLNITNPDKDLFGLKVGSGADYDLYLDEFKIE